jgi:hypothetical protein
MRALSIAVLSGLSLVAAPKEDFRALTQVASTTYPAATHYAVVCDYAYSKDAVNALADALGAGHRITVINMQHSRELYAAGRTLRDQHPELVVLLPEDRLVRDGSFEATWLVGSSKANGLITVGTRSASLRQGAAWAIGQGTKGDLMVDPALRGIVGPVTGREPAKQASFRGRAEITFATR